MTRPLIRHRIDELEALFESSHGEISTLMTLENELTFRQVPRAVSLLAKVRKVLAGEKMQDAAWQANLFNHQTPAVEPSPLRSPKPDAVQAVAPAPTPPSRPVDTMTIEDAHKVLRVTPAATWESIENSRRRIVDRAHPDAVSKLSPAQRSAIEEEATRANAAYIAIVRAKVR